jgi:hypothetical protein
VRNELLDLDCIKTEASQQPGSGLCFRGRPGGEEGVERNADSYSREPGEARHRRWAPEEIPT